MKKKKRDSNSFINILYGIFHRRNLRRSHIIPLLSAGAGCLLFLFAVFSFLSPPINHHHHPSFIRKLVVRLPSDSNKEFIIPFDGGTTGRDLWSSSQAKSFYGCSNGSKSFLTSEAKTEANRYLLIATSGGLNQQRTGITDAVVAAYILNATLVVPKLDQRSFWKDASNFSEVFDVDWFISYLAKDVEIIKELPLNNGKVLRAVHTRAPRRCSPECYKTKILPLLIKKRAVQLGKFDYRLANRLEPDLQKLRCRVNYHALRFTNPIYEMGKKLVQRMRSKSKHFITLHLRYEPDMLAFSGCDYGGGEKEKRELGLIRKRWKTLHKKNPDRERRQGRCPLTPEEVGLMLRALGYGNDVHIYVASGEIYGGEETLAPLKALFPNFHSKDTIASKEELAPFLSFSSRMAALDFIVCDESDVFVTNNNGNMAKILAGRRRYFGHKPTIRPNAKKFYRVFMNRNNMTWEKFASSIRTDQIGFMGEPNEIKLGRGGGVFHEKPAACICKKQNEEINIPETNLESTIESNASEMSDEDYAEDDQDWSDTDEMEKDYV